MDRLPSQRSRPPRTSSAASLTRALSARPTRSARRIVPDPASARASPKGPAISGTVTGASEPSAAKKMIVQLATRLDSMFEKENKMRQRMMAAAERAEVMVTKLEDNNSLRPGQSTEEDTREVVQMLLSKTSDLSMQDRWSFMESTLKMLVKADSDFQQFTEDYIRDAEQKLTRAPLAPQEGDVLSEEKPTASSEDPADSEATEAEQEAWNEAEEEAKVDRLEFAFKTKQIDPLDCIRDKLRVGERMLHTRASWRDSEGLTYVQLKDRLKHHERRGMTAAKVIKGCDKQINAAQEELQGHKTKVQQLEELNTQQVSHAESLKQDLVYSRKQLLLTTVQGGGVSVPVVLDECKPPPSGWLTVVVVRVDGSADFGMGLWSEVMESVVRPALQLFNNLTRQLLLEFQGYETSSEGDHSVLVFPGLPQALAFTTKAQLGLLTVAWPSALVSESGPEACRMAFNDAVDNLLWRGLRVGMAIHCGELVAELPPESHRTRYYGVARDTTQELSCLTRGGEILLSSKAYSDLTPDMLASVLSATRTAVEVEALPPPHPFLSTCGSAQVVYRATPEPLKQRVYLPRSCTTLAEIEAPALDRVAPTPHSNPPPRPAHQRRGTTVGGREGSAEKAARGQTPMVAYTQPRHWDIFDWAQGRMEASEARIQYIEDLKAEIQSQRLPQNIDPPRGNRLTVVVVDLTGTKEAWELDKKGLRELLMQYAKTLRELLSMFSGYEARCEGDHFVTVFRTPRDAIRFALALQEDLMHCTVSETLSRNLEAFADVTVYDEADNGVQLWSGPRARIAVHSADQHHSLAIDMLPSEDGSPPP
eukprot:RCo042253